MVIDVRGTEHTEETIGARLSDRDYARFPGLRLRHPLDGG